MSLLEIVFKPLWRRERSPKVIYKVYKARAGATKAQEQEKLIEFIAKIRSAGQKID
jgi:hypothetical protein